MCEDAMMKVRETERWPDRQGWDEMANAIEALAESCGASVVCGQKYQYLSIEMLEPARHPNHTSALHVIIELIEQASEMPSSSS
jgi:hypothetical protein